MSVSVSDFIFSSKAWISLATQAQVQAQGQAKGMTQVKTKCDANTSTSKIIRTCRHLETVEARDNLDPVFSLAEHNHV